MPVSAEARWFWRGSPGEFEQWFRSGDVAAGGGGARDDEYLVDPRQQELGIKKRAGKAGIEIKGLVDVGVPLPAPFPGRLQIWSKWTSYATTIDHLPRIVVRKTRWVRKYDTGGDHVREIALDSAERPRDAAMPWPEFGCQMELTEVATGDDRWWTFGFEAFGSLQTVESSLLRTVAHLRAIPAGSLAAARELSYPAWLAITAQA